MAGSYPSAKIKLRLVLEEFANPFKPTAARPPLKPSTLLKGVQDTRDTLRYDLDPDTPPNVTRYVLVAKGATGSARAANAQNNDSRGLTHLIPGIMPIEATWKLAGLRAASTLSCKLKYIDFPVDPRVIRACAIEYYLGCVTAEDYARGLAGELRSAVGSDAQGEPFNVVPDTYFDSHGQARTNLRFLGWVDTWQLDWGEGEPTVMLECRDNTQLLIKQEAPSKLVASAVNDNVPIDEAIAGYLVHFPQFEGLEVEYRPTTTDRGDVPRLKGVLAHTAFVPELGPQVKHGGGSEKMSVWDYLTDVCGSIGHIVRVDGTTIVIQKPSTIIRNEVPQRPDDPYLSRTVDGQVYSGRAMIYGRNISELKMKREYNKKEPVNIEVRCYDPHQKTILVARSPKDVAKRVDAHLPGDKTDQKWSVKYVHGIRDQGILQSIADEYFESGRSEMTASIKTKDMWAWGGDDADPDLFDLKVGDSVSVLLHRDSDFSTNTNIEKALTAYEANVELMKKLGYEQAFADAYAKAYTDGGFQKEFKLREMTVTWNESGVSFDIASVNYVTARIDQKPPLNDAEANDSMTAPMIPKPTAPGGKKAQANAAFLEQIAASLKKG